MTDNPTLPLVEEMARAIAACDNEDGFDAWTDNAPASTRAYTEYAQAAAAIAQRRVSELEAALEPFAALFNQRWAQYPSAPDIAPISLGFSTHGAKRTGDLQLSDFRRAALAKDETARE